MCKGTGAPVDSSMAGARGGKTEDEDKLGLAPVYKGPCVTLMLALDQRIRENEEIFKPGSMTNRCLTGQ